MHVHVSRRRRLASLELAAAPKPCLGSAHPRLVKLNLAPERLPSRVHRRSTKLVENHPCGFVAADPGERKVGAHPHEEPTPLTVVDVEVVLHDPALREGEVPAVVARVSDRDQDAGRLAGFQDDRDLVGFRPSEVWFDELVAASLGRWQDRRAPDARPLLHPPLVVRRNPPQHVAADGVEVAVGVEEPDHPLRLLERLDRAVQQQAIEAAVAEADAILVMLSEGVHGVLPGGQRPGSTASGRLAGLTPMQDYHQLDIWHRHTTQTENSRLPGDVKGEALG